MADVKISALPASTTPLAGTEVLPIVQGTTTKQVAVSDLTAGRSVSASALTATDTAGNAAVTINSTQTGSNSYSWTMGVNKGTVDGALTLYNNTTTTRLMTVTTDGKVSVGNGPNGTNSALFSVTGSNPYVGIQSTNAYNASGTQGIQFFGVYNSGFGADLLARVQAGKENTTDGDGKGYLSFFTNTSLSTNTEKMRIASSGGVSIGNTTDPGATNLSVTGTVATNGVKFPATQVPSADVNTLDDYEEGTFTPVLFGATTPGTGTYVTQLGRYTKIGRQVTIQIALEWTAHTGTGNMQVSGLPFATLATFSPPLTIIAYNLTQPALTVLGARIFVSSTDIELIAQPIGGGAWTGITMDTNVDALLITGTYFV